MRNLIALFSQRSTGETLHWVRYLWCLQATLTFCQHTDKVVSLRYGSAYIENNNKKNNAKISEKKLQSAISLSFSNLKPNFKTKSSLNCHTFLCSICYRLILKKGHTNKKAYYTNSCISSCMLSDRPQLTVNIYENVFDSHSFLCHVESLGPFAFFSSFHMLFRGR